MLELTLDGIRPPGFEQKAAILVVTICAPGSRMARSADLGLARRRDSMALQPHGIVSQEGLRLEAAQLLSDVARGAVDLFEIALMAGEAGRHRRRTDVPGLGVDDSTVAMNTLTTNTWQS